MMSNRPGRKISRQTAKRPQHRSTDGPSLDRRILLVIAVMAVVSVVIAVVALSSGSGSKSTVAQTSDTVQIFGDSLPTFPDGGDDPAIGATAPGFITTDFEGNQHEVTGNGAPGDTAKVVGIFAHWCPHCQRELPIVSQWLADNPLPTGVEVVAVSSNVNSSRGNYPPSSWFASVDWPGPVSVDSSDNAIANAYGLSAFPYWVILSPDNTVLDRKSGELSSDEFAALVDTATQSLNK